MIDARFPETLTKKKASSKFDGIAVSELGDDLPGLLNRMKKVLPSLALLVTGVYIYHGSYFE